MKHTHFHKGTLHPLGLGFFCCSSSSWIITSAHATRVDLKHHHIPTDWLTNRQSKISPPQKIPQIFQIRKPVVPSPVPVLGILNPTSHIPSKHACIHPTSIPKMYAEVAYTLRFVDMTIHAARIPDLSLPSFCLPYATYLTQYRKKKTTCSPLSIAKESQEDETQDPCIERGCKAV